MTIVAVSAAYGAGGTTIGRALAERLDVPFLDRAIAAAVAGQLDVSVDEAVRQWEPPDRGLLERLLSNFLGAETGAPVPPPPEMVTAEDFKRATEAAVMEQVATGEGVILGRGAVAALRENPRVLRVRLSGPRAGRVTRAMEVGGLDQERAQRAMRHLDRYHAEYVRRFYGEDIDDPALYHLTIDATALDTEVCVDLIELAARALP